MSFVEELAAAEIGATFNFYREGPRAALLRRRLEDYLATRKEARVLLLGEAPGYRGARISGLPFTSERQLTGAGPAEATATIVRRVLTELGLEQDVLCWNVVPTHPGSSTSNRRPTTAEVAAGRLFTGRLARLALAHNTLLTFPYRYGFTIRSLTRLLERVGFHVQHVVGDVLVPIADKWTHPWTSAEERVVKLALGVAARRVPKWAPWIEVYAVR